MSSDARTADHRLGLVTAALVFVLAWGAFAPMLGAYWRHDDFGWQAITDEWQAGQRSLWYGHGGFTPAYNVLHRAIGLIGGRDPLAWRIVFTTMHAGIAVAVAWLCLLVTGSRAAAGWAGAFFALHWVHHEAIGWIAGGLHVPATLAAVLAVGCWIVGRGRADGRWLASAIVLAALAPMLKESGLAVFALIAAAELLLPLPRERGRSRWAIAGLGAALALYVALRLTVGVGGEVVPEGERIYRVGPHVIANLAACVPQMIVSDMGFGNYRALLAGALPQNAVEAAVVASRIGIGLVALGLVYQLVSGARAGCERRTGEDARATGGASHYPDAQAVRFAVAWMFLGFLPSSLFVYELARAPRYLYLPSVGLALLFGYAIAAAMQHWPRRRRPIVGLAALVLLANLGPLALFTRSRLRDSVIRREIAQQLPQVLPDPRPGERIAVTGIPAHIDDLPAMTWMLYGRKLDIITVRPGQAPSPADRILRFADGRLSAAG